MKNEENMLLINSTKESAPHPGKESNVMLNLFQNLFIHQYAHDQRLQWKGDKKHQNFVYPRPLRERVEFLSEHSELRNSGEGFVRMPSQHPSQPSLIREGVSYPPLPLGEGATHLDMPPTKMKFAFTLAEVLITLGVIGVIAAMTIPGLMTKYHKSVVENKLKKFYSTINQATRLSIEEHEGIIFDTSAMERESEGGNAITDKNFEKNWYNEYILKYLTGVTNIDTQDGNGNQRGIKVSLNDGSGFTSFIYMGVSRVDLYLFYCIDANDKSCKFNNYDGKNTFMFSYSPDCQCFVTSYVNSSSDLATLKNDTHFGCYKGHKQYCTRLIEMNGWKIPDDYPWIK